MKATAIRMGSHDGLSDGECKFQEQKKTILIPEMNRIGARLFAATLRRFDLNARALPTGKGTELGRKPGGEG